MSPAFSAGCLQRQLAMPCPSQWTVISRRCPQAYPSRGLPTPPWEVLQYSLNPNSDVDTPGNLERAGERQKQGNLSYLNFPEISWYLAHCRHLPPRSSLWWGIGALGISDLPHRDHCSKSPLFELWAASWERGHQLHADRRLTTVPVRGEAPIGCQTVSEPSSHTRTRPRLMARNGAHWLAPA